MATKLNKRAINPIHGIRTLGMLWIIAGHVYYFALSPTDNMKFIFANDQVWILQPIYAAASSVDTFFVISGLLLAFGFCEKEKKRPSKNLFVSLVKGIINRYLRIAPCFMIVMLFAVSLSIFINDTSQFKSLEDIEGNCKNYWYRNLLFIQNFYPIDKMCLSWSWYVAADFQLFSISSALLVISKK
jgi:peptidoglycan/LPS O-acetylase OafA/YrhL